MHCNKSAIYFISLEISGAASKIRISRVSCQKGPTRHAYAWQIGPFWQNTLDMNTLDMNTLDMSVGELGMDARHICSIPPIMAHSGSYRSMAAIITFIYDCDLMASVITNKCNCVLNAEFLWWP